MQPGTSALVAVGSPRAEWLRRLGRSPLLWVAFGYTPLLIGFGVNLWSRPHYQFFPLALAGAAFLAGSRRRDLAQPLNPGSAWGTKALIAGSFLCLTGATVLWSPWLGAVAAYVGLVAMAWQAGSWHCLRAMLPALLVLATILPPPLAADLQLIQKLRVLAVQGSSRILDLLTVTHALSGNVVEMPGKKLLVDEACSGINSVLITLAASLFYGLWRRRSFPVIVVCVLGSLAFVLMGNVVRITLGAWLSYRYHIDILSGRAHEIVGLVLLCGYLMLIVSLDQLMAFLTHPASQGPASGGTAPARESRGKFPPPRLKLGTCARATSYAFALVGLAGLGVGATRYQRADIPALALAGGVPAGTRFTLPEQIGDWRRMDNEEPALQKIETMGVCSQTWHYRRGEFLVAVALDYPFKSLHDVRVCYRLRGWQMVGQEDRTVGAAAVDAKRPFAEVRMRNQFGQHGNLWFSAVDARGHWQAPESPEPSLPKSFWVRVTPRPAKDSPTYQMQALWTGFAPLTAAEAEAVGGLYNRARLLLWKQLAQTLAGGR